MDSVSGRYDGLEGLRAVATSRCLGLLATSSAMARPMPLENPVTLVWVLAWRRKRGKNTIHTKPERIVWKLIRLGVDGVHDDWTNR